MKATVLVSIYGICAIALLTFYAVYAWLAPTTPLLIGAVAVLLPALVLVYALEEDARLPKPDAMLWAKSMLIASIFGLALPALWTKGDARAKALGLLPTLRSVELAMADSHAGVQHQACVLLFEGHLEVRPGQIADILSRSPQSGPACLNAVPPSGLRDDVTRQLAVTWHRDLLDGTAAQCPNVQAIDQLPIAAPNRVGFMLDCALRGNAETRPCCVAQLAAAYPGNKLESEIEKSAPLLRQLGSSGLLLAAAFNEATYVASIAPAAKQLRLQGDTMRWSSLESACTAVTEQASRPDDMRYLEWLFDQNTNCLEDPAGTTDVVSACKIVLQLSPADRTNLGPALCEANQQVRTQKRAAAAAFKSGAAFGSDAEDIDRGRGAQQAEHLAFGNLEALSKSGEIKNLTEEERAMLMNNINGAQILDAKNPFGITPEQMQTQRDNVHSEEGREKLNAQHAAKYNSNDSDVEKVLGVSMDELRDSLDEDGNVSPEMKKRMDERKKRAD